MSTFSQDLAKFQQYLSGFTTAAAGSPADTGRTAFNAALSALQPNGTPYVPPQQYVTLNLDAQPGADITDQLNGLLNNLYTAVSSTVIILPAGDFYLHEAIVLPAKTVVIRGAGMDVTRLIWNADLGSGTYAISSSTDLDFPPPYFYDFTAIGPSRTDLAGPYNSSPSPSNLMGSLPAEMAGIRLGGQAHVTRVRVTGFYAGFGISEDHTDVRMSRADGNYFGAYYLTSQETSDQQFLQCDFSRNRMAGLSMDMGVSIPSEFTCCDFSRQPYAFYSRALTSQERSANPVPRTGSIGTVYQGCDFSEIGNAIIWDDEPTPSMYWSYNAFIAGNGIDSFSASYALTSRPSGALVHAGGWQGNISYLSLPLHDNYSGGFFNIWLCESGIFDLLNSGSVIPMSGSSELIYAGDTRGGSYGYQGSVSQYQVLQSDGGYYQLIVAQSGTLPVGICAAPVNGSCQLITSGTVSVLCDATAIQQGSWVKTGSNGRVTLASGPNDAGVVGVAESAPSSGMCSVCLRVGV